MELFGKRAPAGTDIQHLVLRADEPRGVIILRLVVQIIPIPLLQTVIVVIIPQDGGTEELQTAFPALFPVQGVYPLEEITHIYSVISIIINDLRNRDLPLLQDIRAQTTGTL
jgi:hypothetical protein